MYLPHTTRRKDGKDHRYWRLVRSVRVGRRVVQQTVAHLSELDEHRRVAARALARRLIGAPEQAELFKDDGEDVAVPVRLKGIRIERRRLAGGHHSDGGLRESCGRPSCAGRVGDRRPRRHAALRQTLDDIGEHRAFAAEQVCAPCRVDPNPIWPVGRRQRCVTQTLVHLAGSRNPV